jgi:hypothetical protein
MEPQAAILGLLAELPFKVGRSGLMKILRGSQAAAIGPDRCRYFGVLGSDTEARIGAVLDYLIQDGLVERIARDAYFILTLTDSGLARLETMTPQR